MYRVTAFFAILLFYPLMQLGQRIPSENMPQKFFNLDFSVHDFSRYDFYITGVYLLVYSVFCLWVLFITLLASRWILSISRQRVRPIFINILVAFILFLVLDVVNGVKFPNSQFKILDLSVNEFWMKYIGTILSLFLSLFIVFFSDSCRRHFALISLLLMPSVLLVVNFSLYKWNDGYTKKGVNNITYVLGVDSVRADAHSLLANNSTFLASKHLSSFNNAWSPVGRTYASWNVLTTGLAPENNRVRFNLSSVEPKCTMFNIFEDHEWNIIYGSDEKRFNHIGEKCSLENNLGSSTQALDFVAASPLLDMPYYNLLSEYDFVFKEILPFHIHNRANAVTYDPYLAAKYYAIKAKSKVMAGDNLLVFHFTLPHMPWTHRWSHLSQASDNRKYEVMVEDAGRALDIFTDVLSRIDSNSFEGVIWSDHGESFTQHSSHENDLFCCSNVGGHGTSAEILEQYNIFISFSNIINDELVYSGDSFITSLDILPTLIDWHFDKTIVSDGCNLLRLCGTSLARSLTIESGFTVKEMLKKTPDLSKIMEQGIAAYTVKEGKVILRAEFEEELIRTKGYKTVHGIMSVKSEKQSYRDIH